ncbi:Sec61-gamma subunit or ER translocon [Chloropicon primus]|uniref:Sec61-gamma subunit or ER translocon n=1 Tax=Chloropicon primus TaxID=1764295 RepID=A0A5B8MB53_9CHLO|nr:Sec61-gamma subunit or ER translocon [Chloropicon primus]UPQ96781.1 Sec61-gamma subunit or ER translocon [Chloropicon primus]|mmetsp:Transcript_3044/g.8264  ORF Transcript_3044/g.8264 Transcript_3044/m.8264 type:complete len:81 (-) Transcript_3044:1564-1806(-)|eukprot:QDZ17563.1 Sec61-gamma subunit or ER translocon [Chloropicon primus]
MDLSETFTKPLQDFAKNSVRLIKRCTKPDAKEYKKICFQTIVGFSIMGFIGFFVKLIFIPINNIIMGSSAAAEAAAEASA